MNPHLDYEREGSRESLLERVEAMQRKVTNRNSKEMELLKLISQPDKKGTALTDAWLECEIAQRDLNELVEIEIQGRLSSI